MIGAPKLWWMSKYLIENGNRSTKFCRKSVKEASIRFPGWMEEPKVLFFSECVVGWLRVLIKFRVSRFPWNVMRIRADRCARPRRPLRLDLFRDRLLSIDSDWIAADWDTTFFHLSRRTGRIDNPPAMTWWPALSWVSVIDQPELLG